MARQAGIAAMTVSSQFTVVLPTQVGSAKPARCFS